MNKRVGGHRRTPLLIFLFLTALVASVAFAGIVSIRSIEHEVLSYFDLRSTQLAGTCERAVLMRQFDFVFDLLNEIKAERNVSRIAIVMDGRYYFHTDESMTGTVVDDELAELIEGTQSDRNAIRRRGTAYDVAASLGGFDIHLGKKAFLIITYSLADLQSRTNEITISLAVILVLIVVIAIVFVLLRRLYMKVAQYQVESLTSVSHELRSPLTAIKGTVENLLDGIAGPLGDLQRENLLRVARNTGDLETLINDLLDVTALESGQMPIELEKCELNQLIRDCIDLFEPLAREKGIALRFTGTLEEVEWVTDRGRIRQVLVNLIGNGIKFTDAGSVEITLRALPQCVEIAVRDTGIGIPPDQLAAVFNKYYRIRPKDGRKVKGSGLGLTIARSIVTRLGGTIKAESTPGAGSVFTCTFARGA